MIFMEREGLFSEKYRNRKLSINQSAAGQPSPWERGGDGSAQAVGLSDRVQKQADLRRIAGK